MLDELDLNKLRIFRELAVAKSFTKAAQNLKQPKSRISRTISALEKEMGVQLIYRTTRSFELTHSGQLLFNQLSPLLNELKTSLEMVVSDTKEVAGMIKVTSPEDIASELLGPMCQEFLELYPKTQIKIHASNVIVDMVKDQFDVAVRIGKAKDSTLIQKKIGTVDMELVMSPELYKKHLPKRLEDLEKMNLIAYDDFKLPHVAVKVTRGKESKTLKVRPHLTSNNFLLIKHMVLRGSGFSLIPSFLVKDQIMKGELITVFKEWKLEGRPLHILIPHQKEVPIRIRKFLDFLTPRLTPYF
ncbi:LysR substrate-binding domain-containing protein [Peredibacter sp. HCB2-198]|uniref:LysR family transcriptional regulator n=1 Tax=Peredibacter sp. HCB2-198 TaxID=3383025 RepID=UPI0038B4A749